MFVNGNAFIIKAAREINFATVEHIQSQTPEKIRKVSNKVIRLYGRYGFIINAILINTKFEKVNEILGNVKFKITASR